MPIIILFENTTMFLCVSVYLQPLFLHLMSSIGVPIYCEPTQKMILHINSLGLLHVAFSSKEESQKPERQLPYQSPACSPNKQGVPGTQTALNAGQIHCSMDTVAALQSDRNLD